MILKGRLNVFIIRIELKVIHSQKLFTEAILVAEYLNL